MSYRIYKIKRNQLPTILLNKRIPLAGLWVLEIGDTPFEEKFYGGLNKEDLEAAMKK